MLPTIASRCQAVRFDPPDARPARATSCSPGRPTRDRRGRGAALSLGDGEKALALAARRRPGAQTPRPSSFARAPLHGTTGTTRPWKADPRPRPATGRSRPRTEVENALKEELQYLPKKEHKRRETEFTERARRADRRAATQALDHALQLTGLWYRDLSCVAAGAPELVFHSDRTDALTRGRGPQAQALHKAQELVDDTRARLILNVSEELACEALAYRLEETPGAQ